MVFCRAAISAGVQTERAHRLFVMVMADLGLPDDLFKTVGVDGPTASSARIGLLGTKTGAVHDRV
jgi:hypothetical protein